MDRPAVVEWYGGTGVRCRPAGVGGYYRPTARGNIGDNSGHCGGGFGGNNSEFCSPFSQSHSHLLNLEKGHFGTLGQ